MRRNNLDIEADLLKIARSGSILTWLVYNGNMNFNTIKPYLENLIKRGLLEKEGKLYMTTPKGEEYMKTINACQAFQ